MNFKAKKRVILSDFETFLTQKFAKRMFIRAILPCRAVAKAGRLFKLPLYYNVCYYLLLLILDHIKMIA